MARITFSCLPASWYCSVSLLSLGCASRQRLLLLLLLFITSALLLLGTYQRQLWGLGQRRPGSRVNKYLSIAESMETTDVLNAALNYGIVVDCGSSGSRVFVYYWPPHNGNPHTLLDIRQMRDRDRKPVVKKIKPGISTLANTPTQASDYLHPLLSFAAAHVPKNKHKETPLYILCTAGMRLLPESQQADILEDLVTDVPLEFDFLFSRSHAEVISGKQEGVYAWIGINFVLGRFDHADEEDATVEVTTGSQNQQPISRRRTVGIMDMGGASLQIAYEVPSAITFSSPQEEEAGKSVLAEFNLGCDVEHTQHVYRVYVTTFLGFGGNMARQRYEDQLVNSTLAKNRFLTTQTGLSEDKPYLDPCLPVSLSDTVVRDNRTLYLRGQGDWSRCREAVRPFLGLHNGTMSPGGVYQSEELRIVLVGRSGAGKTSVMNMLMGRPALTPASASSQTTACETKTTVVNGQKLVIVDTPGVMNTKKTKQEVERDIVESIVHAAPGPHVFLLVMKLQGPTTYDAAAVEIIQKMFGEKSKNYTLALFTGGEGGFNEEDVQKTFIGDASVKQHHFDNTGETQPDQVAELLVKINAMVQKNDPKQYTSDMLKEVQKVKEEEEKKSGGLTGHKLLENTVRVILSGVAGESLVGSVFSIVSYAEKILNKFIKR